MSKRLLGLLVVVWSTVVVSTSRADITATANPLNLGSAIVGDAGGTSQSTIINDASTLSGVDLVVDPLDADCNGFTITSDPTDRIPPFSVTVKFVATTRGGRTCTIQAFTASTATPRGTFEVIGIGIGPHLTNPATVAIGNVRVKGTTSKTG
jgi:hypothetical protein